MVASLRQNTETLQAINDNFIYQLQDERMAIVSENAELAAIIVKASAGDEMTEPERLRYNFWILRELSLWEVAFSRNSDGVMPPAQWAAWDSSFRRRVPAILPEEVWNDEKYGYGDEFRNHVDAAYADMRRLPSN